jgi:transposase-like protein
MSIEIKQRLHGIQKADLQSSDGASRNCVAVDETAIQIDSDRFWLYTAVNPRTNEPLHVDISLV